MFYRKRGSLPDTVISEIKQIAFYIRGGYIDNTLEQFWYWLNLHNIGMNLANTRLFTKPFTIISNPIFMSEHRRYSEFTYTPVRFHRDIKNVTYLYDVNIDNLDMRIVTKNTRRYFIHRYGIYKRRILSKYDLEYHSELNEKN